MIENSKYITIKRHNVFLTIFMPLSAPIAIVQINHGLAEHSQRYFEFARYLCQKGFGVYVHDHPGHGKSALMPNQMGHASWKTGWDNLLEVIHGINKTIRKAHPSVPVFLLGHSMGSLLSRYYNATYPMYFKGMIISGTANPDSMELKASLAIVRILRLFYGEYYKSDWMNNYFYRNYNQKLSKTRTHFDWLSSNPDEVDKYIDDPLCGLGLTLGFYKSLLQGSLQMLKTEKNLRIRKNFSTLIISGKKDPVGNFGKGPKAMRQKYMEQGYFNTYITLLEGRHELLNEMPEIKRQAFEAIANWIDDKLKGNF